VTTGTLGYEPLTVFIDSGGTVWAGLNYGEITPYFEGGAARFRDGAWSFWNQWDGESAIATNRLTSLAVGPAGEVGLGTLDRGVDGFMESWWRRYNYGNGLPGNEVGCIAFEPSGAPWLSVTAGLFRFDGTAWEQRKPAESWVPTTPCMAFAPDGTVWTGGNGVFRAEGDSWIKTSTIAGIAEVTCLTLGPDGAPWSNGRDWYGPGAFRFNGAKWQVHRSAAWVSGLAAGPDGGMYAAPDGEGVVRIDQTPLTENIGDAPLTFAVTGNRPNPFNPSTVISFTLPHSGPVDLAVYDITGRKLRTLVSGPLAAGSHTAAWNGRDEDGRPSAAGVYFAVLRAGKTTAALRMMLVK